MLSAGAFLPLNMAASSEDGITLTTTAAEQTTTLSVGTWLLVALDEDARVAGGDVALTSSSGHVIPAGDSRLVRCDSIVTLRYMRDDAASGDGRLAVSPVVPRPIVGPAE